MKILQIQVLWLSDEQFEHSRNGVVKSILSLLEECHSPSKIAQRVWFKFVMDELQNQGLFILS